MVWDKAKTKKKKKKIKKSEIGKRNEHFYI